MLDYLGIIEKRVNDVIQLHAYVMNKVTYLKFKPSSLYHPLSQSENSYEMPQIIKGHREDSTASGSHANIPDDKHEQKNEQLSNLLSTGTLFSYQISRTHPPSHIQIPYIVEYNPDHYKELTTPMEANEFEKLAQQVREI